MLRMMPYRKADAIHATRDSIPILRIGLKKAHRFRDVLFLDPAEPCNRRLGTLPSKVGAYLWPHCSQRPVHLSRQVNREMRGEVCKTAAELFSSL